MSPFVTSFDDVGMNNKHITPYMLPNPANDPYPLHTIFAFMWEHYIIMEYIILFGGVCIGVFTYLIPYNRYIMTGKNKKFTQKLLLSPIDVIAYYVFLPILIKFIVLAIDYSYISSLPVLSVVYYVLYMVLWSIMASLLSMYFLMYAKKDLRENLDLYTFNISQKSWYALNRGNVAILLQFCIFLVIVLQVFNLINIKNNSPEYIWTWGLCMLLSTTVLTSLLMLLQHSVNRNIKEKMYRDVKYLVNNGNLGNQYTYYNRDHLGSYVSEYNRFTDSLREIIEKIKHSTVTLESENSTLRHSTLTLNDILSEQEINVAQMNIATNTTSSTIKYLLTEIKGQADLLKKEQKTMESLVLGTNDISDTFRAIVQGQEQGEVAHSNALTAVENSLKTTNTMNEQIENIHQKIKVAGKETSAIDEALVALKNIAEQTNLLSMSAAIEAAHGDTSRGGFTLVAEEVRKLAQMSQDSVSKISIRLSAITSNINEAYSASKESIELSNSSLTTGARLKTSIQEISQISKEIHNITKQAAPITAEQEVSIATFKNTIADINNFLEYLVHALREGSTSAVMLSLNFRSMIQSFKQSRTSLYNVEANLDQLHTIENHLVHILKEFVLEPSNKDKK